MHKVLQKMQMGRHKWKASWWAERVSPSEGIEEVLQSPLATPSWKRCASQMGDLCPFSIRGNKSTKPWSRYLINSSIWFQLITHWPLIPAGNISSKIFQNAQPLTGLVHSRKRQNHSYNACAMTCCTDPVNEWQASGGFNPLKIMRQVHNLWKKTHAWHLAPSHFTPIWSGQLIIFGQFLGWIPHLNHFG